MDLRMPVMDGVEATRDRAQLVMIAHRAGLTG
jgi:CheY-like chemotaxis protein